ncbi:MAG: hypothetical protein SW127_08830 [Actinomycetota bacterium]|nr:hypothetical protein [Actinomycetota bacterium]
MSGHELCSLSDGFSPDDRPTTLAAVDYYTNDTTGRVRAQGYKDPCAATSAIMVGPGGNGPDPDR